MREFVQMLSPDKLSPFDFIIPIQEKVKVEDNAIVYTVTEETPTENTQGEIGQMAYNTVDLLCWKCRGLFDDIYIWDKQDQFTYPENGTKEVTLIVHKDISGNKVKVNIYNFRMEKVMDKHSRLWIINYKICQMLN